MDSTENSIIRIPFTFGHKFWLGFWTILAVGFTIAWIMWDSLFLLGFIVWMFPGYLIGRWIAESPGKIEIVPDQSYFVRPRSENFTWGYDGENWHHNVLPINVRLRIVDTEFRWSDDQLEILTSKGAIFLGSGEQMLPIRDWLAHHGLRSK